MREITQSESQLLMWQFQPGMMGSWQRKLWDLMAISDSGNLNSLEKAFPHEVGTYRRFSTEHGYWKEVCDAARKQGWSI